MKRVLLWQECPWSPRTAAGWTGLVACACLLGCGEAPDLPPPSERAVPVPQASRAVSSEDGRITVRARDVRVASVAPEANDPTPPEADEIVGSAIAALADSDANARADAVSALGDAHDNPDAASLAYAALSDADPAVREEAAYVLGEIGGEMSLRALEQALRDPEVAVQRTAIEAIASIGGDQAALALAPLLNDPDAKIRAAAADAMSEIWRARRDSNSRPSGSKPD